MGGFYNAVFGKNPVSSLLLEVLGNPEVGRFRDAWVESVDDELRIAIYTRNGGGNRVCWNESIDTDVSDSETCDCVGCLMRYRIHKHPLYLFDRDDEFDCTYATIYYRVPEEYEDILRPLATDGAVDMDSIWQAFIERVEDRGNRT